MGVDKVSSASSYTPAVSNRNPANKKELMASYQQVRNIQKSVTTQAIINAVTGNKGIVSVMAPNAQQAPMNQGPLTPQTPGQLERVQNPNAKGTAKAGVPKGNTVSAGRMEATVVNAPGNTGNVVKGPEGFASSGNRAVVNGANNSVDLTGSTPAGTRAQTHAMTGGAAITNANVTVTGSGNAVKFNGGMQDNTTVNLNGNNNVVNVGNNVDKANVNVAGNNVTVNLANNNPLTKNQNSWNINVSTGNVNITVENGEAKVTGANGNQDFKVEIDNKNRTVTVTPLEQQNAGII
ncbi:MAG: hypothetical protein V1913_16995 [Fibrobacterota bacterium]